MKYIKEYIFFTVISTILVFDLKTNQVPFIIKFMMIGILQYHLVLILHECVHLHFFKNKKLNSIFGHLTGALVFISFTKYQVEHRNHHLYTATDKDPDLYIYKLNRKVNWTCFLKHFLFGGLKEAFSKQRTKGIISSLSADVIFCIIPIQLIIFFTFYLFTKTTTHYFVYWCLPLLFIAFYINRLRINIEHGLGHFQNHGINIHTYYIQKLLFFSYGFDYHYTHHQFPNIPGYQLPNLAKDQNHNALTVSQIIKYAKKLS